MLLIGSKAAELNGVSLGRVPVDVDLVMTPCAFKQVQAALCPARTVFIDARHVALLRGGTIVEVELAFPCSTGAELLAMAPDFPQVSLQLGDVEVSAALPPLDLLLTLKLSHRFKRNSAHFLKTMDDIWTLRKIGTKVAEYGEFLRRREAETYTYAHPSLKQSKKGFFNDDVSYFYDHDSIHEVMAHLDKPAYKFFAKEGEEVYSARDKWDLCSEELKLYAVVEESYVLALERSQVPFRGKVDPKRSFDMALQKVCTSVTSGWFREHAWEHYWQAQALYDPTYSDRFFALADAGKVKLHT